VVADAKYKSSRGTKPSAQNGYQLFAYSHLATLDGQGPDIGLILYPVGVGASAQQHALQRMRDRGFVLWHIALPFPSRADIHSSGSWSAFIARLAQALRDFSMEWTFAIRSEKGEAVDLIFPNRWHVDY
jgi:hypothetical protein